LEMNHKILIVGIVAGLTISPFAVAGPITPKLAEGVKPQPAYESVSERLLVANPTPIFSDISPYSSPVGQLEKIGQPVDAIAQVKDWDWILVGRNGVGVGYVARDLLMPTKGKASGHTPGGRHDPA
jgi:hypothetical protein